MYAKLTPSDHIKVLYQTDITFNVDTNIKNPRFTWYRDDVKLIGDSKSLTLYDCEGPAEGYYRVDIEGNSPEDDSSVAITTNKTFLEIIFSETEYPENCEEYYYHEINGAVFTYMHWWVYDDIRNGVKHGVDWIKDPMDPIFKYPCHVAYISFLIRTFDSVYIQESRNGRILLREDFAEI